MSYRKYTFRSIEPEVLLHCPSLGLDRHVPQLVGVEDVDAVGDEDEVVHAIAADTELANEDTLWIPATIRLAPVVTTNSIGTYT